MSFRIHPFQFGACLVLAVAAAGGGMLATAPRLALAGPATKPAAADPAFGDTVRPIVGQFCVSCHNSTKKKGDLDLARFETSAEAIGAAEVWSRVAQRLGEHEMPPKSRPQPLEPQRQAMLTWIKNTIEERPVDCHKIATDENQRWYRGFVMGRRLTRTEYSNTVRDLLGVDLHAGDFMPADGSGGEGFDTTGDTLFMSAMQVEKYLRAADHVLRLVLPDDVSSQSSDLAAARHRLLFAVPGPDLPAPKAARQNLSAFIERAFRRPAADAEVDRFAGLFERSAQRGDSFDASMRLAMEAVLISPHFLFLVEPTPEQDGVYELGEFPLASRLSYFLWSTMPDDTLMSLARQGRLHEPEVLRAQVRRMLDDPRSRALGENFACQWLGTTALGGAIRPDPQRFPEFDDQLADAMRQEVVLFFNSVVTEDHSLLDLIDADYSFANDRLARLYGIEGVSGGQMRRVHLPDRSRGGVLGLAAVLTSTSYPLRTSPVLRGKWVMEQLLGEHIPPPPPTAGQLPPDDRQPDGLTFRQRLEQHRSRPECASCHQKMDPLGFGLENFDPIGRWRATQLGHPVDASAQLPSGEHFTGPAELRQILLRRRNDFLQNFCRKMTGYALGRELTRYDQCVVNDSMKALEASHYRPSSLFEQIVLSVPFRYRYAKK